MDESRQDHNGLDKPYSVYEVHLGSWKRHAEDNRFNLSGFAEELVNYVKETVHTHRIYAIMEYPYDPSWGSISRIFCADFHFGKPDSWFWLINYIRRALCILIGFHPF
jgi:1,4-alpha-glucan branching enzyme